MACVLGPEDSIGDSVLSSLVDPGASRRSAGLHGKCLDPWAFSPAGFETGFWCVSSNPVQRHLKQDKGAGEMAQIRPLPYKPGYLSSIPEPSTDGRRELTPCVVHWGMHTVNSRWFSFFNGSIDNYTRVPGLENWKLQCCSCLIGKPSFPSLSLLFLVCLFGRLLLCCLLWPPTVDPSFPVYLECWD